MCTGRPRVYYMYYKDLDGMYYEALNGVYYQAMKTVRTVTVV